MGGPPSNNCILVMPFAEALREGSLGLNSDHMIQPYAPNVEQGPLSEGPLYSELVVVGEATKFVREVNSAEPTRDGTPRHLARSSLTPERNNRKNVVFISIPTSEFQSQRFRSVRSPTNSKTNTPKIITKIPKELSSCSPRSQVSEHGGKSDHVQERWLTSTNSTLPPSPVNSSESPILGPVAAPFISQHPPGGSYKTFCAASQYQMTRFQQDTLERAFAETEAPTNAQYHHLSGHLKMPRSAVMAYFQKMRIQSRKQGTLAPNQGTLAPNHVVSTQLPIHSVQAVFQCQDSLHSPIVSPPTISPSGEKPAPVLSLEQLRPINPMSINALI